MFIGPADTAVPGLSNERAPTCTFFWARPRREHNLSGRPIPICTRPSSIRAIAAPTIQLPVPSPNIRFVMQCACSGFVILSLYQPCIPMYQIPFIGPTYHPFPVPPHTLTQRLGIPRTSLYRVMTSVAYDGCCYKNGRTCPAE